ncbi:unnamed protein product [Rotaria sordida]|uniref:VIT domain-containing protein n=1 Tax=Rotaria sordida TaxID=392033 RepID=A0A815K856_9BILA|nr:unnamed protein product [Rotaria sordida]
MLWIKKQSDLVGASNDPVPLKEIHVDARLHSFAADVTLTQVFQNNESVPIEAVYCFPVEENAAIYSFVARIDDEREIVAQLKEKKTAQQEYTQAIAQGHGAYLFEQDEASNDIFVVSVGALKPGSQCRIKISYVSELDLLHGNEKPTIRFVIPTTIAPRYSPAQKGISSPGGTQTEYAESVPYNIEFICQVDKLEQHVAGISSPSHPIKVDISNEEAFLVMFSQQGIQLDRDIIVDVELRQVTQEYNKKTMHQAESLIKSMKADLGGTELLEPLQWLQKSKPPAGCVRQIFLLTDGEVSNVDQVINICRDMAEFTRIFSFGLGHSPSRALASLYINREINIVDVLAEFD